jgi:hypothetical protein
MLAVTNTERYGSSNAFGGIPFESRQEEWFFMIKKIRDIPDIQFRCRTGTFQYVAIDS